MRGGDISNEVPRRAWVVWEDVLVTFEPEPSRRTLLGGRQAGKLQRAREDALRGARVDFMAKRNVVDLAWRFGVRCSIVSFLFGDDDVWRGMLDEWLDREGIPCAAWAYSVEQFVAREVHDPYTFAVYAPPSLAVALGGKAISIYGGSSAWT